MLRRPRSVPTSLSGEDFVSSWIYIKYLSGSIWSSIYLAVPCNRWCPVFAVVMDIIPPVFGSGIARAKVCANMCGSDFVFRRVNIKWSSIYFAVFSNHWCSVIPMGRTRACANMCGNDFVSSRVYLKYLLSTIWKSIYLAVLSTHWCKIIANFITFVMIITTRVCADKCGGNLPSCQVYLKYLHSITWSSIYLAVLSNRWYILLAPARTKVSVEKCGGMTSYPVESISITCLAP